MTVTTFIRVGNVAFNPSNIQSIDLYFDPRKWTDRARDRTGGEPGVEIILMSGHGLVPFFKDEARVLRDYFEGRPCDCHVHQLGPHLRVVHLLPERPGERLEEITTAGDTERKFVPVPDVEAVP